ncbi:MAG TPA: molybdenum cofactor guanylyltransferase [Leptolyngbyaceae cyanobacterium M33_DOE_097]|uniref:Probable molybdenum cofactor guanylyltransferase n=1 Tax=Oscillatoriales cyanobacterium SpSt-418 TaxID=2282169 RepID=A0A7C3KH79_9CYAN|nr:molybdenum cofactor guanylyltransferase [Leptolyngbyaceae cyanobacterium M33_DOE_097]
MSNLSAIVLAGGQSRRMGSDKALLSVAGQPLLRYVCEQALVCVSQVWVVTPWGDRYRDLLPPGCEIVDEEHGSGWQGGGPLLGFAQGLSSVTTGWVLLLACDLPNIRGETLKRWAKQRETMSPAISLLPRGSKGWEPLCGFYQTGCRVSLEAAIARGCRSFHAWLMDEAVQELLLESGDREQLLNCNTPEDWASLGHPLG